MYVQTSKSRLTGQNTWPQNHARMNSLPEEWVEIPAETVQNFFFQNAVSKVAHTKWSAYDWRRWSLDIQVFGSFPFLTEVE